jgi:N,N'-diacetyllegionaminate synthase
MSVLVIAEAGVNHNGELALARRLVDAAADAGADLVKFQTFRAGALVSVGARKAAYQLTTTAAEESQHDMIKRLELSPAMHKSLIAYCGQREIGFFSAPFDIQSVDLLAELGLDRFKIPSGELTNLPYLRHVGSYRKPVIMSTGMASLDEVREALEVLIRAGTPLEAITVLHCNTEYPTPMHDVNLRAMATMRTDLGVAVGYSDHTAGIEVSIAAVALGATVIEKHLTLDRKLPGPDHAASLEPAEFAAMVAAIRNVESALGSSIKRPSESEAKNAPVARKSIVAMRPIRAGEKFTPENITAKRPGTGISAMRWDEVIGQPAVRDFVTDELIQL